MFLAFFVSVLSLNMVNSAWFAQTFEVVSKTSTITEEETANPEDDPFKAAYKVPENVDLYFASVPSEADIYFDDVYMGKTPLATSVRKASKFHYAVIADPKVYTPYAGVFSAEKEESLSVHAGLLQDEVTERLEEDEASLVPEQELYVQAIDFSLEDAEITAKLHNDTDENYNYAFVSFRVFGTVVSDEVVDTESTVNTEEAIEVVESAGVVEELEPHYKLLHNIKAGQRYTFTLSVPETVTEVKLLSVLPLSPY